MDIKTTIKSEVSSFAKQIDSRKTGIFLPKNIGVSFIEDTQYIAHVSCNNTIFNINFNPKYLKTHYDRIISEVIPHEIAHIATIYMYDRLGHDWLWKELCLKLGGNGKQFFEV